MPEFRVPVPNINTEISPSDGALLHPRTVTVPESPLHAPQAPSSASVVGTSGGDAANASDQEEVRLVSRDGSATQDSVRLFVTPELNETRTVNYQEISEMRQAGGLLIYIGTQARTYSLTARFVSRNDEEATKTFDWVSLLKGWTVPNKSTLEPGGQGAGGGIVASENAPEVVKLFGYGELIRGVPVVITSLSIDYPAGVTYIESTQRGAFIPIIQTCNISLKEARNITELENFKLTDYKLGRLPNW